MQRINDQIKVGLAQLAPVWLDKKGTLEKVIETIHRASQQGVELLVFGEGFVPGYPLWTGLTDATLFDSPMQK